MLTVLAQRRDDWLRHLDTEHRLEPQAPASLFDREARSPDFLAGLRAALPDGIIHIPFHGRVLPATHLPAQAVQQLGAAIGERQRRPALPGACKAILSSATKPWGSSLCGICAQLRRIRRAPGMACAMASPKAGGVEASCSPTTTVVGAVILCS